MNPRFEGRIKEFDPFITNVEDQGTTEKEMLESEAGCYTTIVEKILEGAMILKRYLFGRRSAQCILNTNERILKIKYNSLLEKLSICFISMTMVF